MDAAERSTLAVGGLWPSEVIRRRNVTLESDDGLTDERAVWLINHFICWESRISSAVDRARRGWPQVSGAAAGGPCSLGGPPDAALV
jgi:hypothetical protein